jgi:hypothetical protein
LIGEHLPRRSRHAPPVALADGFEKPEPIAIRRQELSFAAACVKWAPDHVQLLGG